MPSSSSPAKTYCTLREAFTLIGEKLYGREWKGFEADCDPAKAKQPTDTTSLLRKLAPDGQSYSKERHSVPKRPLDGKDSAKLKQAIERYAKTLTEFLCLTHDGFVPTEFIPEDNATARKAINASSWPDPKNFDPEMPDYHDLWFDIAAGRVVLKSAGKSATSGHGRDYGDLWWAYTGRPGHVEIDRGALDKALRPPEDNGAGLSREDQKKGGSRPKYDQGLQSFINQCSTKFAESGKPFSLATLKDWLLENARDRESYESGVPDCDELEFVENRLYWKDRQARPHSRSAPSLERYIQRAKQR
jgi:hypothetical protein